MTFGDGQIWKGGELLFLNGPEVREILDRNGIVALEFKRDIGID